MPESDTTGLLQQERMLMTRSGLFTTKTSGLTWEAMCGQELVALPFWVAPMRMQPIIMVQRLRMMALAHLTMHAT